MGRPAAVSDEDKLRIVLSVLSGEVSIADAARRNKVSENSVSSWKQRFLEGGKAGLEEGSRAGGADSPRERQLAQEVEDLKTALGEAHVELRVWKKSAEYRLGPSAASNDQERGGDAHLEVLCAYRHP